MGSFGSFSEFEPFRAGEPRHSFAVAKATDGQAGRQASIGVPFCDFPRCFAAMSCFSLRFRFPLVHLQTSHSIFTKLSL